jgi:hypothetical protein
MKHTCMWGVNADDVFIELVALENIYNTSDLDFRTQLHPPTDSLI